MQFIPLSQIPSQTFNIVLSGQDCTISIYYRQNRLYLDLSVGTDIICQGAICANRVDIVQSNTLFFLGTLHFFDLDGDRSPQWEKLHTGSDGRYVFVYVDADEELPASLRY